MPNNRHAVVLKTSRFKQCSSLPLAALTLVCPAGNMMSRGQKGSRGQRQKAAINGSLNKTGANITNSLQPDFAKVEREFLIADSTGQTAWLLKLLSVMGPGCEKWKRTFN